MPKRKINPANKPLKPRRSGHPPTRSATPAETPAAETPQERMVRVNNEIREFMLPPKRKSDPDKQLRFFLMAAHVNVNWDVIKGSPAARPVTDQELQIMIMKAAGFDVIGR